MLWIVYHFSSRPAAGSPCRRTSSGLPEYHISNDKLPAPGGNIVELTGQTGATPIPGESAVDDGKYLAIGSAGDAYTVSLKR